MTQGHEQNAPLHCPRCGGLMRKPVGSNLYWHADNKHPRCNITNIVESALEVQSAAAETPAPEPPKPTKKPRNT